MSLIEPVILTQHSKIPSADGLPLSATVVSRIQKPSNKIVLIIPAMGVPRQFYNKYAYFLCEQGFTVLSFDYRGMGDSGKGHVNPRKIAMRDWAEKDIQGAIDWAMRSLHAKKLFVISQSAGGQLVGLTPNNYLIDAMIAVTVQSGYWGHWSGYNRLGLFSLWYFLVPCLGTLCSVFPGKHLGLGANIPSGVAKEWARWGRHPDYMQRDANCHYFDKVKAPILFYSFEDDEKLGPKKAVSAIIPWFQNAQVEWRHLTPEELNADSVGHFGFFKEPFKETLWQESVEWLRKWS